MANKEYQRAWRAKNPGKVAEYQRAWRAKNPERAKEATEKWRADNREKYLEGAKRSYRKRDPAHMAAVRFKALLIREYSLTPEAFEELLTLQGNRCAICQEPPPEGKRLYVDHYHATGEVRGLLCNPCNISLRKGRDTIEHLERALAYVKAFSTKSNPTG